MFERLKTRVSRFTKQLTRRALTEKDIEDILLELETGLLESDVALEVVEKIIDETREGLTGKAYGVTESVPKTAREAIVGAIRDVLGVEGYSLLDAISSAKLENRPFLVLFVGYNGTGKTTTIAKVAKMLMDWGFTCVIAASDTYRAAAIEQLQYHADKLGVKMITHKRGADSAAVIYDAVTHAKSKGIDVILADTAGRVHTNINLMDEMRKIVRVNKPDSVIFVGDALAGNDIVQQVKEFNDACDITGVILTKVDADVKGGAAVSVSYTTKRPIMYVGVGQGYDDIQEFSPDWFVDLIFSED
ncbi:MAG: signal recognition particle-docking protein FtsY [Theionarchaea archaeon]|nr:signal recognition particle-docking protein FtsY [Theionarchaea archaeon]